jgi:hypothetical protein
MEMRGEKVDVNTIKQNVQDRAKEMGEDIKSAAQNLSAKAKEFSQTRGKAFAGEVKQTVRRSGSGIGHAIGVLFKVFFLFIAGSIAFGLFIAIIAIIFGGVAWWPFNDFIWSDSLQPAYAWGTLILFMGVPLIGFLVWIIRRIIGVRSRSSYLGWVFGGLWALGWVALIMLITNIVRETSSFQKTDPKEIAITQPKNKMTIMVSEPVLEYTDRFWWADDDATGWNISEDSLRLSWVDFTPEKSPDSNYHILLVKQSWGRSSNAALKRAEEIQYKISSKDSVIDIGNGFAISKNSKFRGQNVEVIIQVPVGKKLRFDESVSNKLKHVEVRTYDGRGRRRGRIDFNDWFGFRTNVDYVMTDKGENGTLVDPNRPEEEEERLTAPSDNDYRYNKKDEPVTKDSVEEQRKKVQEAQQKLKEMEDKRNKQKKDSISGNSKRERMDDNDNQEGFTGSSIFSLVQIFN